MRIFRGRNATCVDYLEQYLLEDEDYDRGAFVEVLKSLLENSPSETLVLMAVDGEHVRAFILAFAPQGHGHVFIMQAWSNLPLKEKRVKDELFYRLVFWADNLGRDELRGETLRKTGPFLRAWDFEVYSTVLRYKIPEDYSRVEHSYEGEKDQASSPGGEKDGQVVQSEHSADIDIDKGPEEGFQGVPSSVGGEVGTGAPAVSRPADSGPVTRTATGKIIPGGILPRAVDAPAGDGT